MRKNLNPAWAVAYGPTPEQADRARRASRRAAMDQRMLAGAVDEPRGGGRGRRGGRRGFGRARRGDVRAAVLALLAEQPRHGYDLINELAERTGGVWKPSPGSIYPALALLEDEGLVRAEEADGKRVFHLTDAGRAEAARREGPAPWDEAAESGSAGDLVREAGGVMAAARQFRHVGTAAQRAAAVKVLADARRSLYRILAEDEPASGSDES